MDAEDFKKINQIAISFHDWIHPEQKSQTEAALSLNKTNSAISECCRGIKKTAYGFIWKYKIN
jgi:predicted XRE-type DNA-binding protein